MSFDEHELAELHEKERLNPFRAGRCLSTNIQQGIERVRKVSIPFEQGDVFRRRPSRLSSLLCVSIPFEQGDVFRRE